MLAKTIAAAVEIFKEFWPSPPVPQVSIVFGSAETFVALSLRTKMPPANSSFVSPFFIKASRISIIWFSSCLPSIKSENRDLLSSNERFWPCFNLLIASDIFNY